MCMSRVYTEKTKKKKVKELTIGKEYIRCYRAVSTYKVNGAFTALFKWFIFERGLNKAKTNSFVFADDNKCYKAGFHCYTTKKAASWWCYFSGRTVIEVLVKPAWVTTVGLQNGTCLICSKAVFPKYPKTKVTIREFRKAAKGH